MAEKTKEKEDEAFEKTLKHIALQFGEAVEEDKVVARLIWDDAMTYAESVEHKDARIQELEAKLRVAEDKAWKYDELNK